MRSLADIRVDLATNTAQAAKLDRVLAFLERAEREAPTPELRSMISQAANKACSQLVALARSQKGLEEAHATRASLAAQYARGIVAVARRGYATDELEGVLLSLVGCATIDNGWLDGLERAFVEAALAVRRATSQDERARTFAAYVRARQALLAANRRAA